MWPGTNRVTRNGSVWHTPGQWRMTYRKQFKTCRSFRLVLTQVVMGNSRVVLIHLSRDDPVQKYTAPGSSRNDSNGEKVQGCIVVVPDSQPFLTQFFTERHQLVPDPENSGTFTVRPIFLPWFSQHIYYRRSRKNPRDPMDLVDRVPSGWIFFFSLMVPHGKNLNRYLWLSYCGN